MRTEISQTEKDKHCMSPPICGISKIKQMNEYNKTETDSQMVTSGYQWGVILSFLISVTCMFSLLLSFFF